MGKGRTKRGRILKKADRQRVVARLFLAGLSPGAIAEELGVSEKTIERDVGEITEVWEAPIDLDEATTWAIRSKRAFSELCLELGQDTETQPSVRQGFIQSGIKLQREYEDLLELQARLKEEQRRPSLLEEIQSIFRKPSPCPQCGFDPYPNT